VIAATNRDLSAAMAEGVFRGDLFHRLHGFPIAMPPLADRLDDIEPLARHFLARHGGRAAAIAPEFLAALRVRPWPGNVRELKHAVEYAAVVSRGGALRADRLPMSGPTSRGASTCTGGPSNWSKQRSSARPWPTPAATAPRPPGCSASIGRRCGRSSADSDSTTDGGGR